MLTYFDLRKGVQFILEGQPYEVLEFKQMGKAQDVVVAQTKIKNLITGKIIERNFHQEDKFEETEIIKTELKFIYSYRDKFCFAEVNNPAKRLELTQGQIAELGRFLKPGEIVQGLFFQEKLINITLPIKVFLKVVEAPPGIKGNSVQGATKTVVLETDAKLNVPLFIEEGDILEVNTEKDEYVRRIEKK